MLHAALARLAPHGGSLAVATLWLLAFSGWLAPRPEAPGPSSAASLRRVFELVEPGEGVGLAPAPGGDVWWITRESAVRFAEGDPTRREVALDPGSFRARFDRAPEPFSAAHVDATGGLWLATRSGAVLHRREEGWREVSSPAAPTGPIAAIATRGDEVYVAGTGLWRGRVDGGALAALAPFAGVPIDHLAADPEHGLALAAQGRVWRSGAGGWREVWQARGDVVTALALAPDGELWIGTRAGLVRVDANGPPRRELGDARLAALAPGGGVSLAGGTALFARYASGWRRVDAAGELTVAGVSRLAPAPLGALWVAMDGRGLYRAGPVTR